METTIHAFPFVEHTPSSLSLPTNVLCTLQVPQVLENYRHRSAAGISIPFLLVWSLGDITNLAGALWGSLLPLVVALAIYFSFADVTLILQCVYYNRLNRRRLDHLNHFVGNDEGRKGSVETVGSQSVFSDEEEPLLSRRESNISHGSSDKTGLPGSYQRRKSSAASARHKRRGTNDSLLKIPEDGDDRVEESRGTAGNEWAKNLSSIVLICMLGAAGWAVAWRTGYWTSVEMPRGKFSHRGEVKEKKDMPLGAELLGYFSAACYLGARIPQILKNWREKSCEGLSLLFFLLSLLGNATYGAGVSSARS